LGNSVTVADIPSEYQALWAGRGKDEREVEYRWVWKNLAPKGSEILDVGCCESRLAEVLAHLGWQVVGIDIRECAPSLHPIYIYKSDIRRTPILGRFDQILAISTIEHVGMRAYGNTWLDEAHGDRMAILEMNRILCAKGDMLITLPFGSSKGDYWIRYYNAATLHLLLWGFDYEPTFYLKEGDLWKECGEREAELMPSGEGALPNAIVCLRCGKP